LLQSLIERLAVLQTQLYGRGDKVLQISEKTAEVRANGFWVCSLADDLSIYSATESIQKLPKQKAYVLSDTSAVAAYILILRLAMCFCRNKIAIRKRRPCVFGVGHVLSLHIYHRFRHSTEFKIFPICKVVIVYGFHRLHSCRVANSNDILVSILIV